nr:3-hydroxyacyl-CoA dehydrogenase type-2-like isoform X1 [Parasteatoda tepidariorum]XP_042913489.1 3-hydroxyacyl-CoA dehydrogenase type-2-like isoform X2 [Parasteatoda tepidariorum]
MSGSIRVIKGLVALVTGGASGLGEATTRRLIQKGASVVICDLPTSNGHKIAEELGDKCAFAAIDVNISLLNFYTFHIQVIYCW